jgi:KaiC/GvpD/RAD55 family RecA-like ATPase/5S rRNA maturation endonuclease (ribonuclease M5)
MASSTEIVRSSMSGAVRPERRYGRGRRCPICNGADSDARGVEQRCHGFLSADGYAHCSREEHAGALKLSEGSKTYGHRLAGPCGCGTMHGETTPPEPSSASGPRWLRRIVAKYDYRGESGALVYQVVRFEPKGFRQRRPDPNGGERWIWNLNGTRRVLYRLDHILEADPERVVYVVEGEKDVEALVTLGLLATCNPGGAGKWHYVADCAGTALRGRRVVVIADADEPGRQHAADVEARLRGVAASVRVIEPRRGKGAADWIKAGGTVEEIEATAAKAPADLASDAPVVGPTTTDKPRWHRASDLVGVIMAHASEPWAKFTLGGEELVSVRRGGNIVIMGPTGSGKSSLVCSLLIEYARDQGPVVVMSRELPADEFMARAIGMQCDASWPDVLRGRVRIEDMRRVADLPRMFIADRKDATLARLAAMIRAAQAEYPDQLVLVAIDYVQIVESSEKDARSKVADVIARIDDALREHGCVGVLISQMSRAKAREARGGDALGADSTDGGAESAAIERAATVTLSIGKSGPTRDDGTCAVELNIGKHRMGGGDKVIPASYDGRTGRWRLAGEARPAAEVKAEREGKRDSALVEAALLAMVEGAAAAEEPVTREQLGEMAVARMGKCPRSVARTATAKALTTGQLAEVQRKQPHSRAWLISTPRKAADKGIPLANGGPS